MYLHLGPINGEINHWYILMSEMKGKENIFLMNCMGFFDQSVDDFFRAFIDYSKINSLFSVINNKKRKMFIVLNERFFQLMFI